ncbi:MAG: phosphoadenosine phosphosulfate reductase family protein [Thermoplasmata archaeon]
MPALYLGKVNLHWCGECELPLVEKGDCNICGTKGEPVKITPPGDVRPAFKKDIELIRDTVDRQWGEGYSEHVIPPGKIAVLNSSPDIDRMDEVVIDGKVIGILRYSVERKLEKKEPFVFLIRPWEDLPSPDKGYVVMDKGAVKPILKGASALAPGILKGDENIVPGDEVLVLGPDKNILGTGPSYKGGKELVNNSSGKGVKIRWKVSKGPLKKKKQFWDDAVKANENILEKRINEAKEFIVSQIEERRLPYAVSYSGGKDSLAVLHLVLETGLRPDLLFVDTGIELPETLENVERVVKKHDLNLLKADSLDGYWNNVEHFGPSARDYRWCCKTCKLGPTGLLIKEHFPEGVLSFIGQRRYESQNRMKHGATWTNPWVPGQVGASPIQEWTALHVWLYLFMKDACYNPWYEKGFERIGCWVCPASDMAELELLEDELEGYERFYNTLERYRKRKGLPKEWSELGMWRWLKVPKELTAGTSIEDITVLNRTKKSTRNISYCSGCGVCITSCPEDALYFEEGVKIKKEICTGCGKCREKCPVLEYTHRAVTHF